MTTAPEDTAPVPDEAEEEYDGPARLLVDGRALAVRARLSGHFEPISGRYQWAGRLCPDPELAAVVRPSAAARLATEGGPTADALIREQDPWGGFRISGTGRPPFAVPTENG
jgi:hypothetical protein